MSFCVEDIIGKQYSIYQNKDQAAEKQNIGNHKHRKVIIKNSKKFIVSMNVSSIYSMCTYDLCNDHFQKL